MLAGGERSQLGTGPDADLGEDVGDVGLDGGGPDEEPFGDLGIGEALGDQGRHLAFRGGEAVPSDGGTAAGTSTARRVDDGLVEAKVHALTGQLAEGPFTEAGDQAVS